MTHWQHPRFHAYFPAGNSYPSILGDMLGDAIGCVGFSWVNNFKNSHEYSILTDDDIQSKQISTEMSI